MPATPHRLGTLVPHAPGMLPKRTLAAAALLLAAPGMAATHRAPARAHAINTAQPAAHPVAHPAVPAARHSQGLRHAGAVKPYPAVVQARAPRAHVPAAPRPHLAAGTTPAPLPLPPPAAEDADRAADRAAQQRVREWYRQQRQFSPGGAVAETGAHPAAPAAFPAARIDRTASRPLRVTGPDIATDAPKASVEDFDRAAAAQRRTIRAAAIDSDRQSTAADDLADAESQIPRTAPTERDAAPFIHGVMPAPAARTTVAPRNLQAIPSRPLAPETAVAPVRPFPAHADLHASPGTRSAPKPLSAWQEGAAPAEADENTSSSAARTVRVEAAGTATARLTLPAPAATSPRRSAPAAALIASDAKHPQLDSAAAEVMADENFSAALPPAAATLSAAPPVSGISAPGAPLPRTMQDGDDDIPPAASRPVVPGNLFDGHGHLVLIPAMKGSHEILVHQNRMAEADGLERIQDDDQLAEMRRHRLLAALPDADSIYPDDRLPDNRRYARPWTVRFLRDIGKAHWARFGTPLVITSAVRTVEFQRRLVRVNSNAAPPTGDVASPHLYGQAADIAKTGMSLTEIAWMRAYLTPIEADGNIDVEEEFQQPCFHLSVYRRYLGVSTKKPVHPAPALQQAKSSPEPVKTKKRLPTALLATRLP